MAIYELARELGRALLASEESLRLADAVESYEADESVQNANELSLAEDDFRALIDQIIGIVLSEATDSFSENEGCGGECKGCGKH